MQTHIAYTISIYIRAGRLFTIFDMGLAVVRKICECTPKVPMQNLRTLGQHLQAPHLG